MNTENKTSVNQSVASILYDMKLGDTYEPPMSWGDRYRYTRVIGGWVFNTIYRTRDGKDIWQPPVFIPYNNEFQTVKP